MPNINLNIKDNLTSEEQELFSILKEVIKKYTPSTLAYVAGGWVRDRLLNKKSDDIDIMVNNVSGADFAKMTTQYMGIKDPHVIKANPNASKHLETAGAAIPLPSGAILDVDFAMARAEVYNDNSRIPEIKPATPEEDASRRDLTINSLLYNIISEKVEDFTGMGIKDLITNTIRTPLDPNKTFQDDPLRIFRCIRFSSKYNGTIDKQTLEAMQNPELKEAILKKVSKERIKEEITKTLKGPNPLIGINLLKSTGILSDLINEAIKGTEYEGKLQELDMNQNNHNHQLSLWDHSMSVVNNLLNQYPDSDDEKRVIMILSGIMHDLGKLYPKIHGQKGEETTYHGHEDESSKLAELILRYLKFENETVVNVSKMVGAHMRPHMFVRNDVSDSTLRRFIRNMAEMSLNWNDVLNHAIADAYSKGIKTDQETINDYNALKQRLEQLYAKMSIVKEKIIPVLNGNEIMQILNIKASPKMKEITEFVKELQDENPNITKEDAKNKLLEKFSTNKTATIKIESSSCPWNLVAQKSEDIQKLIKEEKFHQAVIVMGNLIKEYKDDDRLAKMIAKYMISILSKDNKFNDINIIKLLMSRSNYNTLDGEMSSYMAGLLLLSKINVDENKIKQICENAKKMEPEIFSEVISNLPDKVFYQEILNKYKKSEK